MVVFVADGVVDVGLVLDFRVEPAVIDAQGYEVDVCAGYAAGFDGCVLAFEVGGEFWAVMSSI